MGRELYRKTSPLHFSKRARIHSSFQHYKSYAERDCKRLDDVNRYRATEALSAFYGNAYPHGYPLAYDVTSVPKSIAPYMVLAWGYTEYLTGLDLHVAQSEWNNGPLSQLGNLFLFQTFELHRLVNHQIIARLPNRQYKTYEGSYNAAPNDRLTPNEFANHYPKLAHLQRFVGQQGFNNTVPDRRRVIPILDKWSSPYRSAIIFS